MKEEHLQLLLKESAPECKHFTPVFKGGFLLVEMKPGDRWEASHYANNYLILVLSGTIFVSRIGFTNRPIHKGEMWFCPKNSEALISADRAVRLLVLNYSPNGQLNCVHVASERLSKSRQRIKKRCSGVTIKPELQIWVDQVVHYLETGLNCPHMHLIKQQELYLIFKGYYNDEEKLAVFHTPLFSSPGFMEAVLENYQKVKTAEELASMLGYGIKTFRKLFMENFGETPYKWMQEQIALQIKAKLLNDNIPLKQIMFEFRFSTSSHFNYYCKHHFGDTPMQVRLTGKEEKMTGK